MLEFISQSRPSQYRLFMGDDKYENEFLIAHGWPEDVWFHVDEYSSAHVYVRLPKGQTISDLPDDIIEECCQLTKGNSIEGHKQASVNIVYTPWSNLKKDKNTETGTIGFKVNKNVLKVRNVARNRELLKALEKTRQHIPRTEDDYIEDRRKRDRKEVEAQKAAKKQLMEENEKQYAAEREKNRLKNYVDLKVDPNQKDYKGDGTMDDCRAIEEDFM